MTKRSTILTLGALTLLLADCGLVSGVSDYAILDEPPTATACSSGGCADGSLPGTPPPKPEEDAGADASPPNECDPKREDDCVDVPPGFTLVALADFTDPSTTPQCPSGFGGAKTVGTNPQSVLANACACSTCNVTEQAKCRRVLLSYGSPTCSAQAGPNFYENDPPACKNTGYVTPYVDFHRWRFDNPEGGQCTPNAPTKNFDAVVWNGPKNRMCTSTSPNGCAGGRCKVTVVPPYRVCVAAAAADAGDCPATFPIKSTLGSPEFDCGGAGGCSCTVNRAACAGKMFLYSDTACTQNEKEVPVDNVCAQHAGVGGNVWPSFKTTATSQTTCTSTGNPSPTNLRLAPPHTVCCR